MNKIYQTIIIGAGPAGLIAGRYLENSLILDKKQKIGNPVQCGEGISKKALEFQGIKPDPSWITAEVYNSEFVMPNGKAIKTFCTESVGYIVDRVKFEESLAKKVKSEIRLNQEVADLKLQNGIWEVTTKSGEIFKSKYIIGADGYSSIVKRKIFPENQKGYEILPAIGYLVETEKEINQKTVKFYFNNEKYNQGYAWIFPKSKNSANIGLGSKEGNLTKKLNNFLENIVKKEYGNYKLLENKSGVIPLRTDQELKISKDGAMLVGDAAGLADSLFKGGITQSMSSAKIAAECILKDEVNLYESKIRKMPFVDPKLVEARKILYSFDNKFFNKLGELLKDKNASCLQTLPGIIKVFFDPYLAKNIFKVHKLLSIWNKNRNHLW